ncbi:MAG: SAM-dependent methyltransferase [Myxococcota bacterium]|jgi:SAM-dependent methyltransferase
MNPAKSIVFESVGHADLEWCAPLPPNQPDAWFATLEGRPPRTVVDLGCGTGAFLRSWSAANRGWTVGIDHASRCVDAARSRSGGIGQWVVGDAADWAGSHRNAADLVVCIGVEDLGGSWREMLKLCNNVGRRGKWALVGVTVRDEREAWNFIPELAEQIPTLHELQSAIRILGWRPADVDTADAQAWQRYDEVWRQSIDDWCSAHPGDPDVPQFRERLDRGRRLFDALGADALTFVTVLARI